MDGLGVTGVEGKLLVPHRFCRLTDKLRGVPACLRGYPATASRQQRLINEYLGCLRPRPPSRMGRRETENGEEAAFRDRDNFFLNNRFC